MTLACVLLFTGSNLISALGSLTAGYGLIQILQIVGILFGIGASTFVMINQRKTIVWKKKGGESQHLKKREDAIERLEKLIEGLKEDIKKDKTNG